ncbi:TetR family transcriptional regulator [Jatrophihabitans sp. GAS493]|uniref:TetR/AcrR family transcriptional regulator n=1 Tax=Jatrophihabitans sp. GAS493 TaxID=1907575 RepID=UPI000BB7A6B9|nr:TetR/AcrR family transcriptional regulator [Jatrophihabitans sp. GAS493]SOD74402.1 TetR family transcriptional regulator [Jatrophihabitans sp. GAS493]
MSNRAYGGRTAEQRRADRHARLVESATELFGTDGYAATPIERICSRAGVSTRNFYEEFDSREALLMEVHGQLTNRVWMKVFESLMGLEEATMQQRAVAGLTTYVRETVNDPIYVRIIHVEIIGVSPAVEDYRFKQREKWTQIVDIEVQRAISRGEVIKRDYSIGTIGLIGAVTAITHHWWRSGRTRSPEQLEAELIHFAEVCMLDLTNPDSSWQVAAPRTPAGLVEESANEDRTVPASEGGPLVEALGIQDAAADESLANQPS